MAHVTSVSDDGKFQCHHNNKGYCKFKDQCHFRHFYKMSNKNLQRQEMSF